MRLYLAESQQQLSVVFAKYFSLLSTIHTLSMGSWEDDETARCSNSMAEVIQNRKLVSSESKKKAVK